ncbi:hypothetical protein LX36DRAFT_686164 [Colletotrichum falcatum]|nr:hypothetical protein LX36DRAFT_686164 [Colletotrichum falcatum]
MCNKCHTSDHEAAQIRGQPRLLSTMSRSAASAFLKERLWEPASGCADGKTMDQTEQIGEKFKDEAADPAPEAAETLALEIAANAFCRVAIMAATLPLRLITFVGWIASIALQVAMQALVKVCAKFKDKDYEVKVDKSLTSKADRPTNKSPTKASEKPKTCKTKRLAARAFCNLKSYTTPEYIAAARRIIERRCNGERAKRRDLQAPRPIVGVGWLQQADLECERDEYPGASVWQARDNSISRATWLFGGCPDHEQERLVGERSITTKKTLQVMEAIIDILFTRMCIMPPDFGITANPCWPKTLVDDPGFALLTNDPWYRQGNNRGVFTQFYDNKPGPFPGRRALDELDPGKRSPAKLVIREGNSTRRPTAEELFEDLCLLRCTDQHCQREIEELGTPVATPSITGSSPEASIEVPASFSYPLEVAAEISDAARSIITPASRHNLTI